MSRNRSIEKLRREHDLTAFDCGHAELNSWLLKHALQHQEAHAAQTYIALAYGEIVGYYSLALARVESPAQVESIAQAESPTHVESPAPAKSIAAPQSMQKPSTRHPVNIMLLQRFAVHKDWRGMGRVLLKDAVLRTMQAAEIAGIRALAVHVKDDRMRRYYERFDFIASPTDPLHLFVLLKDLRKITAE